jgi:hypothetical protein
MEDDLQWKTTSNGRRPPMEDDLQWKITSNGRRPPMEDNFNRRQPPMEDNLKIIVVEYFSNHCMDCDF